MQKEAENPHRLRVASPWRWVGVLCGASFAAVGASIIVESFDTLSIVFGVLTSVFGAYMVFFAVRYCVILDDSGVTSRTLILGAIQGRKVAWSEVEEFVLAEGQSVLPIWTVVPLIKLRGKEEEEAMDLPAIAFYSFRKDFVPRRVRKVKAIVEERAGLAPGE